MIANERTNRTKLKSNMLRGYLLMGSLLRGSLVKRRIKLVSLLLRVKAKGLSTWQMWPKK